MKLPKYCNIRVKCGSVVRSFVAGACGGVLALCLGMNVSKPVESAVVEAQKFVVKDEKGRTLAVFGTDLSFGSASGLTGLMVGTDQSSHPNVFLGLIDQSVVLQLSDGRFLSLLGVTDDEAGLIMGPQSSPSFELLAGDSGSAATLRSGVGSLRLGSIDRLIEDRRAVGVRLSDPRGHERISIEIDEQDGPRIRGRSADGKEEVFHRTE